MDDNLFDEEVKFRAVECFKVLQKIINQLSVRQLFFS